MTQKTSKDFIPYEEALAIEKLGYDEDDFMAVWYYRLDGEALILDSAINDHSYMAERWLKVPALTYSQSFRWFREKYDYLSFIDMDNYSYYRFNIHNYYKCNIYKGTGISEAPFKTYEEAQLECLKKLIEIVEKK